MQKSRSLKCSKIKCWFQWSISWLSHFCSKDFQRHFDVDKHLFKVMRWQCIPYLCLHLVLYPGLDFLPLLCYVVALNLAQTQTIQIMLSQQKMLDSRKYRKCILIFYNLGTSQFSYNSEILLTLVNVTCVTKIDSSIQFYIHKVYISFINQDPKTGLKPTKIAEGSGNHQSRLKQKM